MAEVQRRHYLAEELPGLLGCQSPLLYKVVKQLTSRDVLQNQVPGGRGGGRGLEGACGGPKSLDSLSKAPGPQHKTPIPLAFGSRVYQFP